MTGIRTMKSRGGQQGFSLLEILLVVVIIGILVAVVVPRAQRANTEAKYSIVRQSAQEIGNWGLEWAKRNLENQDEGIDCIIYHYVDTLLGYTGDTSTNWVDDSAYANSTCPDTNTTNINAGVADIMPPDKQPRNPFNGVSYFAAGNSGSTWAPGDLNLASFPGSSTRTPTTEINYYFVYHGTDSTGAGTFHAGMGAGTSMADLRNGIFVAKLRVP